MKYRGSCHCGRNTYEVEGEIREVAQCNCSICSRKGYLLWFVTRDQLKLHTPDSHLATYMFNKHVIRHRFCPTCGCAPFGESVDGTRAAINVRCLDEVDPSQLKTVFFDGRSI